MIFGYCRVSTLEQNPDRQIDALKLQGIDERLIYIDKYSGIKKNKPELTKLLLLLEESDTLIVTSYDRLTRDAMELFKLVELFNEKKIIFKSLKENLDISTATGKLCLGVFAHINEFMRTNIVETAKEGYRAGKERGKKYGRPNKLSLYEINAIQQEIAKGKTKQEIANDLKICRKTLYNYLKTEIKT